MSNSINFFKSFKKITLHLIILLVLFAIVSASQNGAQAKFPRLTILSSRTISLENRQPNKWVNDVFKDNILLTIAYLNGTAQNGSVNWHSITEPSVYEFVLRPGDVFAFHEDVLPQYQGKVTIFTHAHFNWQEGFRSDGYLVGDGVCHLASLMYWTAKDAKLDAVAPSNHDFAQIPDISKEYGVAILYWPGSKQTNAQKNLYITNILKYPIKFKFVYDGSNLKVSVEKL